MDIFESLNSLSVSEACFNEIISLLEEELQNLKAERRHYTNKTKKLGKELKQARKDYFKSDTDAMSKGMNYSFSIRPEEKGKLKKEAEDANVKANTFFDRMQDLDKRHTDSRNKEYDLRNKVNKMSEN